MPYLFLDPPFLADENPIIPSIYERDHANEEIPEGFNSVVIPLDGLFSSNLDWSESEAAAVGYRNRGFKLFWKLNLGLFEDVRQPLNDQTQFLALGLSVKHFKETIWPKFHQDTLGVCLYEGPPGFLPCLKWDLDLVKNLQEWLADYFGCLEKMVSELDIAVSSFDQIDHEKMLNSASGKKLLHLFARDHAVEYIELLARQLPGEAVPYVLFDARQIEDQLFLAQLISKDRFEYLHRGLYEQASSKAFTLNHHGYLGKKIEARGKKDVAKIAVCVPGKIDKLSESHLQALLGFFKEKDLFFRLIDESRLIADWQDVDDLFVVSETISQQTLRMLRGFCAAGGRVILQGKSLMLSNELPFHQWQS